MKHLPQSGGTPREVATAVNELINGHLNTAGTVTLAVSPAIVTTVTAPACSPSSQVLMTPRTDSAKSVAWWIMPGEGLFTINHPSSAALDRTFGYVILGG